MEVRPGIKRSMGLGWLAPRSDYPPGAAAPLAWLGWQGESGAQSFGLDGVGSIPAIPPTQITCFVDRLNKKE
jgi:hypothetical protein